MGSSLIFLLFKTLGLVLSGLLVVSLIFIMHFSRVVFVAAFLPFLSVPILSKKISTGAPKAF